MNNMNYKTRHFEIKSNEDNIIEIAGYASVFDVLDDHGDIIKPGAFIDSINKNKNVNLFLEHIQENEIGLITSMKEDSYGLYIIGYIKTDTIKGKKTAKMINDGLINSFSIGFTIENSYNNQGVRVIDKINLIEVSLVSNPSNSYAVITEIYNEKDVQELKSLSANLKHAYKTLTGIIPAKVS